MKNQEIKWWLAGIIIILSIASAWCLTTYIGPDIASLDIFKPTNKKGDFRITDIYNAVEMNNLNEIGGREKSEDVVIISIDQLGRKETLEVIHTVSDMHPAAIGLDFPFEDPEPLGEEVVNTILFNNLIVSANKIDPKTYEVIPLSFYETMYDDLSTGFVNIDAANTWNVIRTFHPYVIGKNGDTIPNIALSLARIARPDRAQALIARNKSSEVIDFVSREIRIIPHKRLTESGIEQYIRGKVVLIGDTAYTPDIRITPLKELMAGVQIHAYAVQTILESSYIDSWPTWRIWLIAFVGSLFFLIILQIAKKYLKDSGNWLIRVCQFGLMLLIVLWGCHIFSEDHTYADFSIVIVMLGFSALVFDIAYALIGASKILFKIINKFIRK